ncbi:unnamed protein product [Durusdinium trenchii]|uniref:Uncharacterized protein n=1 Tax=Durusdinium trenchii TaxID=1381693 RepID=A0ABP0PBS4_9DINO
MTLCMGRRVPTPSLSRNQISSLEETKSEELSSRKQEQAQKVRCKQPLQRRAGLENVAPCQVLSGKKTSPCKMISASPNKENEEAVPTCIDMQNMFSKRKLFEKEVSEEQMLVEALRTAPTGQVFAALCGLRKALARPRPPIDGVLRCGGAELLVETLRTMLSIAKVAKQ